MLAHWLNTAAWPTMRVGSLSRRSMTRSGIEKTRRSRVVMGVLLGGGGSGDRLLAELVDGGHVGGDDGLRAEAVRERRLVFEFADLVDQQDAVLHADAVAFHAGLVVAAHEGVEVVLAVEAGAAAEQLAVEFLLDAHAQRRDRKS